MSPTPSGPTIAPPSDLNGDGKIDLVVWSYDCIGYEFTNDGGGNFSFWDYSPWSGGWCVIGIPFPNQSTSGDVNQDGVEDYIITHWTNQTLSVAISVPTPVINRSSSNAVVWWRSGWTNWLLQQSLNLTNWSASSGLSDDGTIVSHTIVQPTNGLFFRLFHP